MSFSVSLLRAHAQNTLHCHSSNDVTTGVVLMGKTHFPTPIGSLRANSSQAQLTLGHPSGQKNWLIWLVCHDEEPKHVRLHLSSLSPGDLPAWGRCAFYFNCSCEVEVSDLTSHPAQAGVAISPCQFSLYFLKVSWFWTAYPMLPYKQLPAEQVCRRWQRSKPPISGRIFSQSSIAENSCTSFFSITCTDNNTDILILHLLDSHLALTLFQT